MILRFAFAAVLSLIFILFTGCGDDPSSIGSELIKEDRLNILEKDSFTDSLTQSSSYSKYVYPLNPSARILLGKDANIESSILLKFLLSLTESLKADLMEDSISIVSAEILFVQIYFSGDSLASFDFSAHRITSGWSAQFSSDSLSSLTFDPADVSSDRNFINGDTLRFNIENQLVLDWLKTAADTNTADDNGLYLKPTATSQKVLGFSSMNSENQTMPDLRVIIEKSGDIDTLSFFPSYDISVVTGDIPYVSSENIIIQNSLETQAKISFDISSIPSAAVINYAELGLTLDTQESIRGSNYTKALRVYFFIDSLNNSLDSSQFKTLTASGNLYKGDITPYVQNWVNGAGNQGVLITSAILGEGVELLSFKGSSSADASLRPRLKIVYTLK